MQYCGLKIPTSFTEINKIGFRQVGSRKDCSLSNSKLRPRGSMKGLHKPIRDSGTLWIQIPTSFIEKSL
jgi:hypothetical protein